MSLAEKIFRRMQNWFRKPAEPQNPYAYVTADLKRGPGGRPAAVALEEPGSIRILNLFGAPNHTLDPVLTANPHEQQRSRYRLI